MRPLTIVLLGAISLTSISTQAMAAVSKGDPCTDLGLTTKSTDNTSILACMLDTANASATGCSNGGGCHFKSMTASAISFVSNTLVTAANQYTLPVTVSCPAGTKMTGVTECQVTPQTCSSLECTTVRGFYISGNTATCLLSTANTNGETHTLSITASCMN